MEHIDYSLKVIEGVTRNQGEKGMSKYGQPLNPRDKNHDWLKMLLEELADGVQYTVAEMVKRDEIINEIREIIKYNTNILAHDQISALLDQLEGKHG